MLFTPERDQKCETGCMNYAGEEIRHHKDCVFYPESMSAQIELRALLERYRSQMKDTLPAMEKCLSERDQLLTRIEKLRDTLSYYAQDESGIDDCRYARKALAVDDKMKGA